jgi:Spy/CpxP family protein refolding chaperone
VFNYRSLLAPAALATALAIPAAGFAQVQPSPAPLTQPMQGQRRHGGFGFMRQMRSLNLSAQQQSQIQQLMAQYRQAHPRGSTPDPQARKDLLAKVMAVLTPAQQQQLKADQAKRKSEFGRGRNRNRPAPSPSPAV